MSSFLAVKRVCRSHCCYCRRPASQPHTLCSVDRRRRLTSISVSLIEASDVPLTLSFIPFTLLSRATHEGQAHTRTSTHTDIDRRGQQVFFSLNSFVRSQLLRRKEEKATREDAASGDKSSSRSVHDTRCRHKLKQCAVSSQRREIEREREMCRN